MEARLIDVANGYQLWSETYDSSEQDFLSIQNEVARRKSPALCKSSCSFRDETVNQGSDDRHASL